MNNTITQSNSNTDGYIAYVIILLIISIMAVHIVVRYTRNYDAKNDPYEIKRARHEQIFRETDITPYVYKRYNFFTLV